MRPNVLMITCDQLRKDALGCYDNPVVKTPNIDCIAQEGIIFDQMYVANPACAPSRGAIATGRYPWVNGLMGNDGILPEDEMTIMEALRRFGYKTYGTGKMHLTPQFFDPRNEFDKDEEMEHIAVNPQPEPWEFPHYGFDKGYFSEDNRVGPYAEYLKERGYDPFADPHSFTYGQHVTVRSAYPEEHHQTTWVGDQSLEFLHNHPEDKPFFMWTSFVHPHHPFNPPAPYDTMYDPDDMPLPLRSEAEIEGWPEKYKEKHTKKGKDKGHEAVGLNIFEDGDWKRIKAYYYGMISLIDKQVGKILDLLEKRDMLDNTIIIFTADHGELLGDHNLLFKGAFYDCVTNVPFLLRLPGKEYSGQKRKAFCQNIDILPTIMELTGKDIPEGVQGKSLLPLVKDEQAKNYDHVFMARKMVRTETARLVWHGKGKRGELYDLTSDPDCFENLWNEPDAAELQREMMELLIEDLQNTTDPKYDNVKTKYRRKYNIDISD